MKGYCRSCGLFGKELDWKTTIDHGAWSEDVYICDDCMKKKRIKIGRKR